MAEQLYSAEEAAEILGLQVRTVRNYVREGRLPGVRIGKQYRISRMDLEAFTGGSGLVAAVAEPAAPTEPAATSLEVTSVAQVDAIGRDLADRIAGTLVAVV